MNTIPAVIFNELICLSGWQDRWWHYWVGSPGTVGVSECACWHLLPCGDGGRLLPAGARLCSHRLAAQGHCTGITSFIMCQIVNIILFGAIVILFCSMIYHLNMNDLFPHSYFSLIVYTVVDGCVAGCHWFSGTGLCEATWKQSRWCLQRTTSKSYISLIMTELSTRDFFFFFFFFYIINRWRQ